MSPRSILITGCSSGIGYDAAHTLNDRGWRVFAACRKHEDVERLIDEGLEAVHLDYTDTASIAPAVDQVLAATDGHLDALFNNGAHAMGGAIEDTATDGFRAIFEANFFGWHELTRRVLPTMRAQGHGRIVQCSSVLGMAGLRMRGPYVSTKFAVEGYSDVLRLELANTKIHVILIEPGPINTAIRVNAQPHYEAYVERQNTPWAGFYKKTLEPRLYAQDPPPDRFELPPSAVTAKLIHALESRKPRARYYVATPTYIVGCLKRLLPTRWLDRVLKNN
ncbi:MAG: SDR family NAD(P)-dependent oxidoreductase [Pseudomonadota bacterium]